LSHANRQPQGTASNVTGLPHLQVVTCVEITLSRVHRRERGRAGTVERWNGHLHAVEQVPRRWRGGHDPSVAETRRENLIYAQIVHLSLLCLYDCCGHHAWDRRAEPRGSGAASSPMPLLCLSSVAGQPDWAPTSTICSDDDDGFLVRADAGFPPGRSLQPRPRHLNGGHARPVYAC
jgi:hypothetical protein